MERTTADKTRVALRVSRNSIVANVLLAAFKLLAGLVAHSAAMVSDAVHTLSDVLSTAVVIVGVKLAGREADKDHPYGHERLECVAALILAAILAITGLWIGIEGVRLILDGDAGQLAVPGVLALIAAVGSIVVKELMYRYTRRAARAIHSGALMADAWHHRSDALSSVGSLVGIAGARLGLPVLDPIASVVISLLIVHAAYGIFRDAVAKMTDRACDDEFVAQVRGVILAHPEVVGIDVLKTRLFGDRVYVDVEICVDGRQSLAITHAIAEQVHDAVETRFPTVKHCTVHVNPSRD